MSSTIYCRRLIKGNMCGQPVEDINGLYLYCNSCASGCSYMEDFDKCCGKTSNPMESYYCTEHYILIDKLRKEGKWMTTFEYSMKHMFEDHWIRPGQK